MFDIRENLKKLPDCPGVYIHRDRLGNVIYVGKAVNLRNRVRQYFRSQKNMAPKVRSMVSRIAEFEYITVDSEMEALILECNLIKKHRPKYNVLLRDDKTYPYIKVTNEEWPRVIKTRIVDKDGGHYFGPYSDAGAVNRIVDLLNSSFALKRCSTAAFGEGFRPCLNFHIGQCRGVCTGDVAGEDYDEAVRGALEFLKGHDGSLIASLKQKMKKASEEMRYEDAAECRDDIEAAKALAETQRVVLHHAGEADIVMNFKDVSDNSFVVVFSVREGKLVGRESFKMNGCEAIEVSDAHILSAFMRQHYSELPDIPKEILVDRIPEDRELLQQYLGDAAGHNVRIVKPERGEKRALVKLARSDVRKLAETIEDRAKADARRRDDLGRQIWQVLSTMGACEGEYDGREFRAEAYDISNTNGVDTVGAMVVYKGLKPDRQSYRKFRVRSVRGQDDYGSMKEVLARRFRRVFSGDDKFAVLPDIIFMDGGKGHVSTALEVIDTTGLEIPVAGMVKDDRHRTRALVFRAAGADGKREDEWHEIELADMPLLYRYLGNMQEEVHRFAIEYHHKLRSRNAEKSVLDEIEGIGPKRRKSLLERFGSVEEIRKIAEKGTAEAAEELAEAEAMTIAAAENIVEFFRM